MKLWIKKEFFDQLRSGSKKIEYRDAHITFICEETEEELRRDIKSVVILPRLSLPKDLRERKDLFEDDRVIGFILCKVDR